METLSEEDREAILVEVMEQHPEELARFIQGDQHPLVWEFVKRIGSNHAPRDLNWAESRTARHEMARCRSMKCLTSKAAGAKLFACAGCKVARYCSKECQKYDWPSHKPMCLENQKVRTELQQEIVQRAANPNMKPPPMSDAGSWFDDLHALKRRLEPSFDVVCMNAFIENSPTPKIAFGYEERIFVLVVERLPQNLISATSPPWTRFRFRKVSLENVDDTFPAGADPNTDRFRAERQLKFENYDADYHGYITCVLACPSMGGRFTTATTMIQFGRNLPIDRFVTIVDDWRELTARQVEKITGNPRASGMNLRGPGVNRKPRR